MKNWLALAVLTFSMALPATYAQEIDSETDINAIRRVNRQPQQTTDAEFDYITKRYKVQIENGLGVMEGYSLRDLGKWGREYPAEGVREAEFKALYRNGHIQPCAIMMIYRRPQTGFVEYFCIPTNESTPAMWDKTMAQLKAHENDINAQNMYSAMIWGLMRFSMQETGR